MLSRYRFDPVIWLALLLALPAAGAVRVDVGSAVADGGDRVTIEVTLHTGGESVGGLQNDILFNHEVLSLDTRDCVIHPSIGLRPPTAPAGLTCLDNASIAPCKTLSKNLLACRDGNPLTGCDPRDGSDVSLFRAIIAAIATRNDTEIPNGTIYSCTFRVLDAARLPQRLVNRNVVISTPLGDRIVDVDGADGSVCRNLGTGRDCAERVAVGQPCDSNVDCFPNVCDRVVDVCLPGATLTPSPTKTPLHTPSVTSPPNPTPTPTVTPKPVGDGCDFDHECKLGSCVDGACCKRPRCSSGESCNISGAEGNCTRRRDDGEHCERNTDCSSDTCRHAADQDSTGVCAAPIRPADSIVLSVGAGLKLGLPPQFVAVADVNDDGLDDAVVSSPGAILLSTGRGFPDFDEPATLSGQPHLGRVAAIDLNQDRRADVVALVSAPPALVLSLFEDGSFGEFASVPLPAVPVALVTSDLENDAVPEVIIAGDDGVLRMLRNGDEAGVRLTIAQSIDLGGSLAQIAVYDVNSDGIRDVLVLKAGDSEGVSVLLNRGQMQFERLDVPLAGQAKAMAVADFDDDAILEVAVLTVRDERPHIALLANEFTMPGSSFVERQSVPVSCPGTFNGQPIACAVGDILAGDFNYDGFADLAISISTWLADTPTIRVPGLIQAFVGLGDLEFLFSTRVNVGPGPKQLAAGDFNGDLHSDLVVVEEQIDPVGSEPNGSTIRIVRVFSGNDPIRQNGEPCRSGRQCQSGACVDETCCFSPGCRESERCDIPGFEGQCHELADLGASCGDGEQCLSGFCTDGFCCSEPRCPDGVFCNTGTCTPPVPVESPCNANEQCGSGFCVEGVCCDVAACPRGLRCDIPGQEGTCHTRLEIGATCEQHAQCGDALFCTDGVCCISENCGRGSVCNRSDSLGTCAIETSGSPCSSDDDCGSGNCVNAGDCGPARTPTALGPPAPPASGNQLGDSTDGCHLSPRNENSVGPWLPVIAGLLVLTRRVRRVRNGTCRATLKRVRERTPRCRTESSSAPSRRHL